VWTDWTLSGKILYTSELQDNKKAPSFTLTVTEEHQHKRMVTYVLILPFLERTGETGMVVTAGKLHVTHRNGVEIGDGQLGIWLFAFDRL
jgi:hypothetical protein